MTARTGRPLSPRDASAPSDGASSEDVVHSKLLLQQERARALLAKRSAPDTVAVATRLPMREVRRLQMEVREAKRSTHG